MRPDSIAAGSRSPAAVQAELPPALSHFLHGRGILGYGRNLGEIRRRLIETGRAVPLGEPFLASGGGMADELDEVVRRLRAICPAATGGSPA